MQHTAAITGGTGFLGRATVAELRSRGWNLRILARDPDKARRTLGPDRAEFFRGDATDADALRSLVQGASIAVSLIGIIREAPGGQTFDRLHAQAPAALAAACSAAGPRRIIHISAIGASRQGQTEYLRSKRAGEEAIVRSGLDWTILRPGLIHGPEGEFVRLAKQWVTRKAPPYFFLPYFTRGIDDSGVFLGPIRRVDPRIAPVAVQDVASTIARIADLPITHHEIYNLVGPEELSFPEMLRAFRDAIPGADEKLHPQGIPAELGVMAATAARMLGLSALVPFDAGMAVMGSLDATARPDKSEAHFGFDPRPFRAELARYAAKI